MCQTKFIYVVFVGRELRQDPQPSGPCPRTNGIYKTEACDEYLHCSRGQGTVYKCAGTLIFDDEKGVCAHPDQVARGKSECSEEVRYEEFVVFCFIHFKCFNCVYFVHNVLNVFKLL